VQPAGLAAKWRIGLWSLHDGFRQCGGDAAVLLMLCVLLLCFVPASVTPCHFPPCVQAPVSVLLHLLPPSESRRFPRTGPQTNSSPHPSLSSAERRPHTQWERRRN
jgi:hypothetical protein